MEQKILTPSFIRNAVNRKHKVTFSFYSMAIVACVVSWPILFIHNKILISCILLTASVLSVFSIKYAQRLPARFYRNTAAYLKELEERNTLFVKGLEEVVVNAEKMILDQKMLDYVSRLNKVAPGFRDAWMDTSAIKDPVECNPVDDVIVYIEALVKLREAMTVLNVEYADAFTFDVCTAAGDIHSGLIELTPTAFFAVGNMLVGKQSIPAQLTKLQNFLAERKKLETEISKLTTGEVYESMQFAA